MTCKQCKKDLPEANFLQVRRRKGWSVTKCNACATANMKKWDSTPNVGRKADDVKGTDE